MKRLQFDEQKLHKTFLELYEGANVLLNERYEKKIEIHCPRNTSTFAEYAKHLVCECDLE